MEGWQSGGNLESPKMHGLSQKFLPNSQGPPIVVVLGSGGPISALQLSASAKHKQPRVSNNGP